MLKAHEAMMLRESGGECEQDPSYTSRFTDDVKELPVCCTVTYDGDEYEGHSRMIECRYRTMLLSRSIQLEEDGE